ncbi:MAG: amino acid permease [Bacteroidetes bacterium]|nr:amino acid permease [Bacteroidota bacterium]
MPDNKQHEFIKSLSLFDSMAIVIGSMIGSGIFIVSADMARMHGSPGLLLAAWVLTGLLTIFAALSYGELASMMPKAGGQYIYLRESYGPLVGFLFGWTQFAVIQTGTIAAVGIAFAKFTSVLIPWFSPENWIFKIGIFGPFEMPFGKMGPYNVGLNSQNLLAILTIILLTWINTRGIQKGKFIQNIFTATKTLALIGLIIIGLFFAMQSGYVTENFTDMWRASKIVDGQLINLSGVALLSIFGASLVGSLFSADAWNNITFISGEIKNPKKNIPLSLFYGTVIVTTLYFLANVVYLITLPLPEIQNAMQDRVGTAATKVIFGEQATIFMACLIMISTFGCNNGIILAGARMYYAMAMDKLFFKSACELNENNVPAKGLLTQGIWASILCLTGTYSELLDYVVFAVLIFYALTIFGIFILRKKNPDAERPYKAFGYPFIPAIYIIIAVAICTNLLFVRPQFTWPGLFIVLLGIPIYYIWNLRKSEK